MAHSSVRPDDAELHEVPALVLDRFLQGSLHDRQILRVNTPGKLRIAYGRRLGHSEVREGDVVPKDLVAAQIPIPNTDGCGSRGQRQPLRQAVQLLLSALAIGYIAIDDQERPGRAVLIPPQ